MNVIKDFRNDLLKRKEVKIVINAEKNPGIISSAKIVADNFKVDENLVVLKTLKSKFGRDTFLIEAFIYNSLADKEMIEPKNKVEKIEQPAAAPAPAAATTGGKK